MSRLTPVALAAVAALAFVPCADAGVTPDLAARMAAAPTGRALPVLITLRRQLRSEKRRSSVAVLRALRAQAARSQAPIARRLRGPVRRFWLVDAVATKATPRQIRTLGAMKQVKSVSLDTPQRVLALAPTSPAPPTSTSWALTAIGAPAAWALGFTGNGQVVGSIDTGIDPSTPGLAAKVAGWQDFVNGKPEPYDDAGHGTFTISEMVGRDDGVAPDARVLVAKAFGADGSATPSDLLAAAQWMTDPDGNPATADSPGVINNSWGASAAYETWFRPMVEAWLALGIVPVFASGNSGPDPGSISSPASYPDTIAVGAVDRDNVVAGFCGRGPVTWRGWDGTGPDTGTQIVKPDLVAPGVGVPGEVGASDEQGTGTSMAAPLAAGVVALMRQANPAGSAESIADELRASAQDLGPPGPDPDFGYGLLNAPAAVQAAGAGASCTPKAVPPLLADVQTAAQLSRRGSALVVRGRVIGFARVRGLVHSVSHGRRRAIRLSGPTRAIGGRFRLTMAAHRLTPGRYRISVSADAPGGAVSLGVNRRVLVIR